MSDDDASTYGNRGADAYDTRISRSDDETERTVAWAPSPTPGPPATCTAGAGNKPSRRNNRE